MYTGHPVARVGEEITVRLFFVIGRALSGLGRNLAMTISVVLVSFVSLLFVGIGGLAYLQVSSMQQEWYAKVEVSVYMCANDDQTPNCNGKSATDAQVADVREALKSEPLASYIQNVTYQSANEVYADFKRQYEGTTLGEATTADMMPQAFRIKLKDPGKYKIISDRITGMPGVEQVQDQSKLIQPLITVFKAASVISWGLAGSMGFAAILLITTTIRLSAMARQKETQIMRLNGASGLFIQAPFMLEGAFSALLGAISACLILFIGVKYLVQGWIQQTIQFIEFVDLTDVAILSVVIIVSALLLSIVASIVSLAKYTKI